MPLNLPLPALLHACLFTWFQRCHHLFLQTLCNTSATHWILAPGMVLAWERACLLCQIRRSLRLGLSPQWKLSLSDRGLSSNGNWEQGLP